MNEILTIEEGNRRLTYSLRISGFDGTPMFGKPIAPRMAFDFAAEQRNTMWPMVASEQDREYLRRDTVRDAWRMLKALKAARDSDHPFRRARPYSLCRAYFASIEQLAREDRIG